MRTSQILSHGGAVEAPSVESINMQVRTAMSVPFAAHMMKRKEAPKVEPGRPAGSHGHERPLRLIHDRAQGREVVRYWPACNQRRTQAPRRRNAPSDPPSE